jgi:NTE family protein
VLSAGGMFAAWEAGVWKAFHGRVRPDLVVGASAGAWNGWAIAGGVTPEELEAVWIDPGTATILQPLWRPKPGVLLQKAREMFVRFQPRMPFGLTVVAVPRMRPELVRDAEVTALHLAATASIPVLFPPVRIDGRRYVDGGLMGALPLWAAEEMGATRAIALNVLTALPFRVMRSVIRPPRASRALEVMLLEPSERLGRLRAAVDWSLEDVRRWIELGERDGERALARVT